MSNATAFVIAALVFTGLEWWWQVCACLCFLVCIFVYRLEDGIPVKWRNQPK